MDKKTVRDLDVAGKKVLVRVDFNVPLNDKGEITDDTRITASLPTIQYLLEQKAAVILMAHLGRPKGQVKPELSLAPVAKHLGKLLGKKILFAPDCVGEAAKAAASKLKAGHILLLENLRFHKEEEKNDMEFAEQLASLADLYVNDGFGVSHRAHASVEGVTHFLPAAAGFLLEKEIQYVGQAVTNPLHPFVAIIGGAKVSDKIGVISNLLDKVDTLLIGGGMANTFLAAQGHKMGKSLVEEDKLELAKELLAKAKKNKVKLLLPTDLVMSAAFAPDAAHVTESVKHLNQEYMALDIGSETSKAYAEALAEAKMIVWNGPMGVFEMDAFCKGTEAVAKAVENASMDIPERMIKLQVNNMVNEFAQRLQMQGLSIDQYIQYMGSNHQQFMESLKPEAVTRIKNSLVLEAVVKAENITATEDDFEEEVKRMADMYKMEVDKVKEILGDNEKEQIMSDLAIQKAAELIASKAVEKAAPKAAAE